ncbi:MAG: hypothetical protein JXQ87_12790 [Bacteroidia bacterium]
MSKFLPVGMKDKVVKIDLPKLFTSSKLEQGGKNDLLLGFLRSNIIDAVVKNYALHAFYQY